MSDTVRKQPELDILPDASDSRVDSPLFDLDLFTDFNRTRQPEPDKKDQIDFGSEPDIFDFSINSILESGASESTETTQTESTDTTPPESTDSTRGEIASDHGDDLTIERLGATPELPRLRIDANGPRLFDDERSRLGIVTPQNFDALLDAAGSNPHARDVLRDISVERPRLTRANDPLEGAINLVLLQHPEMKASLAQAAISSCADGSNKPLLAAIAEIAKNDPNFAKDLRDTVITPAITSRETADRKQGNEILMAMSGQWTRRDFVNSLSLLEPDQVTAMRNAVHTAPPEVQKFFRDSVLATSSNQGNRPFDPFAPAQFRQSAEAFDARLQLIAAQPDAFDGRVRRRIDHLESPETLLSALDPTSQQHGLDAVFPDFRRGEPSAAERALVERAFPGNSPYTEPDRPRAESDIDTGYLAMVLDRGILDSGETPATATDVFRDWGVDLSTHGQAVDRAVQRYGQEEILTLARRLALHNALDDRSRQELTGSPDKISPEQLAGVILNGQLGEEGTVGASLTGVPPLEVRLRTMGDTSARTLAEESDNLLQAGIDKRQSLSRLSDHARTGVGGLGLIDHAADTLLEQGLRVINPAPGLGLLGTDRFELHTSAVESFDDDQQRFIYAFRKGNYELQQQSSLVADLSRRNAALEFSQNVYAYEELRQSSAPQSRQDYMALAMVDRYGIDSIRQRAPQVWSDLTTGGGLQRLEDNKLIQSHTFPEFSGTPQNRREEALATLTGLKTGESGNLDLPIRRNQALAALDANSEALRAQQITALFGEQFADFTKLLEAGRAGTKFEEYVKLVKDNAQNLEQVLGEVKPEDIQALKTSITELQQSERAATDPETKQALEARHRAMSSMLKVLDPQSPDNKSIRDVLTSAQSREFREDSFSNWIKENGPVIAATAAAVALTVASVGTASPLAAVLLSSAVALGSSQLTKEALYQVNHHIGDTGLGGYQDRSYAGDWVNKHWDNFTGLATSNDWSGTEENAKELVTSFLSEVAGPLTMEYGQNVVMGLVGLGALKLTQAGLKGVSPQVVRSLVEQPQARNALRALSASEASPAAKAFTKQWLTQISRETGQEVAEEVAEEGFQTVGERALQDAGVGGPVAAVLMTVTSTLLQKHRTGAAHQNAAMFEGDANGGRLRLANDVGTDAIQDLRRAGYRVEQGTDGTYTASTYDSQKPLLEIEVAAPGEEVGSTPEIGSARPGATNPDSDTTRPDSGTTRPGAGTTIPGNSTSSPESDTSRPDNDTTRPDNGTTGPDNGTASPDSDTTRPDNDTTRPDNDTTRPDNDTTRSDNDTTRPDNGTTRPDNGTTRPDNGTTRPDNDSTTSDRSRTLADQTDPQLDVEAPEARSSLLNEDNMRQSVDQLHQAIENLPDRFDEARLELELSDALQEISSRLGIPAPTITVRPDSPRALATYKDGDIEVNESIARQARENPDVLVNAVLHELTHLEQETLVVRRTADLLDQETTQSGSQSSANINERVRQNYLAATGREVSPELINDIMALRNGASLDRSQAQRADTLAQSFRSYSEGRGADIHAQQETNRLTRTLNNIDNPNGTDPDADYLLGTNDTERRQRLGELLGPDLIPELNTALDALQEAEGASSSDTAKLKQDVIDAVRVGIRSRIFEINYEAFQTYSDRPHEIEAHDVGNQASSMTPSTFRVEDLDGPADRSVDNTDSSNPTMEIESRRRPSNRGSANPPPGEPRSWHATSVGKGTWEGNKYPDSRNGTSFFRNDDRLWVSGDPDHLVVAVMDGLGSDNHRGSEIAAEVMRTSLDRNWEDYPNDGTVDDVKQWIGQTVNQGHNQIRMLQEMAKHAADSGLDISYQDPGGDLTVGPKIQTTAVIAALHQDKLVVAWSGDSRAYRFRNGQLEQLTVDDTPPGQPGHIVTNTIGSKKVSLHVKKFDVQEGDRYIVATDGLETLQPAEIEAIMRRTGNAREARRELFNAVKAKAHGHQDNLTAAVFDVAPKPDAPRPTSDPPDPPRHSRTKLSGILDGWTSGQFDGIPYVLKGLERAPSIEFQLNLVDRAAQKLENHPRHNRKLMVAISNDRTLPDAVRDKALNYLN